MIISFLIKIYKLNKTIIFLSAAFFLCCPPKTLADGGIMGGFTPSKKSVKVDQRKTLGSSSRSQCLATVKAKSIELLVPAAKVAHRTLENRPALFVYSIVDKPLELEFTLIDPQQIQPVEQRKIILSKGLRQITLPPQVNLQTGKIYLWHLAIPCANNPNELQEVLSAGLQRVEIPALNKKLINTEDSILEKIQIYKDNGIWHETLELAIKYSKQGEFNSHSHIYSKLFDSKT